MSPIPSNRYYEAIFAIGIIKKVTGEKCQGGGIHPPGVRGLKFYIHINDLVVRAKQRAAIIHRYFVSRNTNNLIRAFKTYVRPMLEYASQTWSPYLTYLNDLLKSVQRSFTKRLPYITAYKSNYLGQNIILEDRG